MSKTNNKILLNPNIYQKESLLKSEFSLNDALIEWLMEYIDFDCDSYVEFPQKSRSYDILDDPGQIVLYAEGEISISLLEKEFGTLFDFDIEHLLDELRENDTHFKRFSH